MNCQFHPAQWRGYRKSLNFAPIRTLALYPLLKRFLWVSREGILFPPHRHREDRQLPVAIRRRKRQFAALPYRSDENGNLQVLLITSRDTGRWVIPKGWPMKNKKPHRAAAIEAFEEAGAIGKVSKRSVGAYDYEKRLEDGSTVGCMITVFPMVVKRLEDKWPEAHERRRQWFAPEEAAHLVEELQLSMILRAFTGYRKRLAAAAQTPKDAALEPAGT